jgi:hypothetical protein
MYQVAPTNYNDVINFFFKPGMLDFLPLITLVGNFHYSSCRLSTMHGLLSMQDGRTWLLRERFKDVVKISIDACIYE